jgi:hypothetical protein
MICRWPCPSLPHDAATRRNVARKLPKRVRQDVEIALLCHQLEVPRRQVKRPEVPRRQVKRPELHPADRALLAVLSSVLPRGRWSGFWVTPGTILRWHAGW